MQTCECAPPQHTSFTRASAAASAASSAPGMWQGRINSQRSLQQRRRQLPLLAVQQRLLAAALQLCRLLPCRGAPEGGPPAACSARQARSTACCPLITSKSPSL